MPGADEDTFELRLQAVERQLKATIEITVETRLQAVEAQLKATFETRLLAVENQLKRVVSHLESESLFCRRDHGRLEKQLFGNGRDLGWLLKQLLGNGQAGALKEIENRIQQLEKYAAYIVGGLGVVSVLLTLVFYWMDRVH